jgi:hypothetical protein
MAFYSVSAGQITAVRFWKHSKETGTHVGRIWSNGGALLASVTFTNETSSGWQQQSLASPLAIAANTTYIVSVNTTNGRYVYTNHGLDSQISNGSLRSVVGNNGRYASAGEFPDGDADGLNYFRDIVFVAGSVGSVAFNPSSLTGGASSTGTITLTSPAPSGGAVVTLSCNNAGVIVPPTVTVPAGSMTRTFSVTTTAVSVATSATISATYNGSVSAAVNIIPPAVSAMSLNPLSVTGGSLSTGTITLTGPAPAGGVLVTLSSNNAAAVVPAGATIAAGSASGTFTVSTSAVAGATSATISAAYNGSMSATLSINSPVLSTITLNPSSVTGGAASTGTAILSGPAPSGGAVVALSAASPAFAGIQGVHSPSGLPQDGTIDWSNVAPLFSAPPSGALSIAGTPGLTATITTANAEPPMILSNCSIGGSCGWYGNFGPGEHILWTGGTYNSSNGLWAANGPLTISFNSPLHGLGFQIMANEVGAFAATLCAYDSADTLLACIPFDGNAVGTADGSAAYVGLYDDVAEISKVTIDASGKLFPHDFAIGELYVANSRRQMVPATVMVPSGAVGATFPVSTSSVQSTTVVSVTGTYVASQSASLTIYPPVLSTITVNPNSVTGGAASVGTATLTGPAPIGGVVVDLSGVNPTFSGIQVVNSPAQLPQDGSIDWSTPGPLFSQIHSAIALPVAGLPGSTVTISTATGQPAMTLNNCSGGNCGFYGNFNPGAEILWVGGQYNGFTGGWSANGPMTINFSHPQHGVGFRIMADELGPFTATVCAYNSANTLLRCQSFTGNGTNAADGSAIFVGLYSDVAEFSRITVDAGGALYPHDFAIGRLIVTNSPRKLVPASVTVPAGAASATFPVMTNSVTGSTSVTVTGTYGGPQSANIELHP